MSRQKIDPEIFWGASKSNSFPVEKRVDVRNPARLQAGGQCHELMLFPSERSLFDKLKVFCIKQTFVAHFEFWYHQKCHE